MSKKHTAAEYEIACCEAQEAYPMNRVKREQYVRNKLRDKTIPRIYYPRRGM